MLRLRNPIKQRYFGSPADFFKARPVTIMGRYT